MIQNNINSNICILEDLIERFYNQIVGADDQRLLNLAFAKNPTQKDLDSFLKSWDIEVYGGSRALMLSYLMKMHPNLQFSDYERPRLEGLLTFFRFANLKIIAHFTKVGRALNAEKIVPMILKGGAMRHIRPHLPRVMGDIDILTIQGFDRACEISKELGYVFGEDSTSHSVDLHTPGSDAGTIDIHRFLDFQSEYDKSFMQELFDRGTQIKAFGIDAILPSYEDMVFIALVNMSKNLYNKTSSAGLLYALFDCNYLIGGKADFSWDIVIESAIKTNTCPQVYFSMKFANKIVPALLPEELFKHKTLKSKATMYYNEMMFYRFYVHDVKLRCKKLKLQNAVKSWSVMKEYLKDKPRHFILKRIKKRPLLVDLFLKIAKRVQKEKKCV